MDRSLLLHFVFEGNDLADSTAYLGSETAQKPPFAKRFLTYNALMALQRMTQRTEPQVRRRVGYIGDERFTFRWIGAGVPPAKAGEETQRVLAALAEVGKIVQSYGGTYAVVLIPSKLRVAGPFCAWPEGSELKDYASHLSPLPVALKDWCEAHAVALLDLTPPLVASLRAGRIPWYAGDSHWNAIGHAVAADSVAEWAFVREWDGSRSTEDR